MSASHPPKMTKSKRAALDHLHAVPRQPCPRCRYPEPVPAWREWPGRRLRTTSNVGIVGYCLLILMLGVSLGLTWELAL